MKKIYFYTVLLAVFVMALGFSVGEGFAAGVKLEKGVQREIEKTLEVMGSNFEKSFSVSDFSNSDLIQFGITNAKFAPQPGQTYADGSYWVPAKLVEETVAKYFNRLVEHGLAQGLQYKKGYYKSRGGDLGEGCLIKITRVEKINDHAIMVYDDNLYPDTKKLFRKERAMFQRVVEPNGTRYVVLSYQILK